MKKAVIILFTMSLLFATSCSTTGVPTEISKTCGAENDGKMLEVSGFLDDKGGVFCSNIGGGDVKCGFAVKESAASDKIFSADIVKGTWANNVEELPRGYKKEDIKIHDNGGNIIKLDEKVKLTGKMMIADKVCVMSVSKIEK